MPERERLNIDFGFAPTQVQQRDIGAAYAAPVARKSAKTKMYEGLAQLSGSLLTAYAGYAKRQRAEEARMKNLSPEEKKELDNYAVNLASASTEEEQKEITEAFYRRNVVSDEKKAIYSPIVQDLTSQHRASNEVQAHFADWQASEETAALLANPETKILDVFNAELGKVQFSDPDYGASPLARAMFESELATALNINQQRKNARFLADSIDNHTTTIQNGLRAVMKNGGDLLKAMKAHGQSSYRAYGSNGADVVTDGALNLFDELMSAGKLKKAEKLFEAIRTQEYRPGRTLGSYNPGIMSDMRVTLINAKEAEIEEFNRKQDALPGEYTKQLNNNASGFVNGKFNDETFNWSTANIESLMAEWKSQFAEPTKESGLQTVTEYDSKKIWEGAEEKMRDRMLGLIKAGDDTDPVWEDGFIKELYKATPNALNVLLQTGINDENVSRDDIIKYTNIIQSRGSIDARNKEFKGQYPQHESSFMRKVGLRLDIIGQLDRGALRREKRNPKDAQLTLLWETAERDFRDDYRIKRAELMGEVSEEKITVEEAYDKLNEWSDTHITIEKIVENYGDAQWMTEAKALYDIIGKNLGIPNKEDNLNKNKTGGASFRGDDEKDDEK